MSPNKCGDQRFLSWAHLIAKSESDYGGKVPIRERLSTVQKLSTRCFIEFRPETLSSTRSGPETGSVSIITDDLSGSYGSPEFPTYSIDKSSLLPKWFAWYSKTKGLWTQCDKLSRGTSGQNRLRPDRFLEVRLPLPPLDEQRQIVARLDRVAGLIEERRKAVTAADADMQALLSKAFERAVDGAPRRPMAEVAPLVPPPGRG